MPITNNKAVTVSSQYINKTIWNDSRPPIESVSDYSKTWYSAYQTPGITVNPKGPDGFRSPSNYFGAPGIRRLPQLTLQSGAVLATTPFLGQVDRSVGPHGTSEHRVTGTSMLKVFAPPPDTRSLQDELRMKVLNNVKSETVDIAMILAEIRGTASTGATLLLRLGRSMEAIRRRKPISYAYLMHGKKGVDRRRITQRFLKETADEYLQWKYGIMPTIYDLQGLTKAMDMNNEHSLFDHPPLSVARATVKRKRNVSLSVAASVTTTEANLSLPGIEETVGRARVDYRVTGDGMRGLSQFGLGLGTIPTVLFDKTPFSFVLNMALPIAELIKAWTSLSGIRPIGYTETYFTTTTLNPKQSVQLNDGVGKPTINIPSVTIEQFSRLGRSTPIMPMPFIRNPVSVGNLSTALALFTSLRDKSNMSGKQPRYRR